MTSSTPTAPTRATELRARAATAFAFLITMMGTTLPTPLYSIYSRELHFSALTVTVLFAVYAIGVVGALFWFGRLSDDLGRRPVLLTAVALALLSAVLFVLPPSLPLLIAARVISGLAAGLMSGAGTAAVLDLFRPEKKATGGMLAVAANTGGLALGTLLAGTLADLAPAPLVTPFIAHMTLCILAICGLLAWTSRPNDRGELRVRPQRLQVPSSLRGAFARAVLAAGSGFSITGVLTAVTALFLAQELHLESHALAGFIVFLVFATMAAGQLLAARMRTRLAMRVGYLGLVVAAGLLAAALAAVSLAALVCAAVALGLAGGLCLNAGIASTIGSVAPQHRGEVSSSFFAGLYLMLAAPAIGVGLLTAFVGLRGAGLLFTAAVAAVPIAIGVAEVVATRLHGIEQ